MPFKKQFGFIFKYQQYPDEFLRTIAHELGHGALRLWHTFSSNNQYIQPEGSTNNLMDYVDRSKADSAILLNKYQWDWTHDPTWRIYAFEDQEEAEMSLPCLGIFDDCDDVLKKIEAVKKAYKNGESIIGKIPRNLVDKILLGKHLRLGNTDFEKIHVCLYGTPDFEYTINPKDYSEYEWRVTQYEMDPEKIIMYKGFEFEFNGNHVLRIFIEDYDSKIQNKFESLKSYLFSTEEQGNEKKGIYLEDVTWMTQEKGQCTAACKSIVASYSTSKRKLETKGALVKEQIVIMNKANSDCSSFVPTSSFDNGIKLLDRQLLEDKVPVTVGVYRPYKEKDAATKKVKIIDKCLTYNSPKEASTAHFVVIVGVGYDGDRKYYNFLDVGATSVTDGSSKNNRLYLDGKQVRGTSSYFDNDGRYYILTEIRLTVITQK